MSDYNTKDIFLQRRTSDGVFEEYPLVVQSDSIIIIDSGSNIATVTTSSFVAKTADTASLLSDVGSNLFVSSSIFVQALSRSLNL